MPQGAVLSEGSLINNRYRVIGLIGGGAMARVYKVEHNELGTLHALKEQQGEDEDTSVTENAIETALREARFLSKLSHAGIPKVTDFFREGGKVYFVMDYVEGQTLKSILDRNGGRPLDMPTVLRWGIQICDVLVYLHSQTPPIIFRDIKPSNLIRRPDGMVSMIDFGIARRVRQGASSDTIVFGSPGYAPPEQYGQGQTEARSDLYALGATLHHLLTGRDPSTTPFKWPPMRSLNPQVPMVLDKLVMKCLEMEVSRRPESAEVVGKLLRNALQLVEEGTGAEMGSLPGTGGSGAVTAAQTRAATAVVQEAAEGAQRNGLRFIPAPVAGGQAPASQPQDYSRPTGAAGAGWSARWAHLSPLYQFLYTLLFSCAVPIVLLCVLFLFTRPLLAPAIRPEPVRVNGDQTEYTRQMILHSQSVTAYNIYENIAVVHYSLAILVGLAFFFGVIRPMRPTPPGMVMAFGGILGLIILTGTIFLPGRPLYFIIPAIPEAFLLIPAALLMSANSA
jgi:tRNA A-37 threonylcarbamoyl transferase component Bud32